LDIINPNFKIQNNNVFTIRKLEYSNLLQQIQEIVKTVEEIGFEIIECTIKDHKFSSGELQKTLKQNLVIKLKKGTFELDLSMYIPKLVDDNYIIINGKKKIPQFQLFDIPIVTRGKNIKLRTNVATILVIENTRKLDSEIQEPLVMASFLGKKVPLSLLMFSYFGPDYLDDKYNFSSITISNNPNTLIEKLLFDLKMYYEESEGFSQDDYILELGRMYSKYDSRTKGDNVVYALDLIMKTDITSKRFFKTNNVLDELVNAIENGPFDDTNFINKRIRCFEYIILTRVSKTIFDLCMSNRTSRQPKFNINSSQILSDCNVSDIVQFDFSINPIDELTRLSRTSLLGPGGFKRENVPKHLRDISETMFGRICPVDTPDRDNCGVLQSLIPNVKLDENLRFKKEFLEKEPISIPISMIPFLEHNDQTRLQMASSQMRQSVMLKNFDIPMIQSGCESLYTKYTQFIKIAKKDGEVLYIDTNFLIVTYNDNTSDIFDISARNIYVENMDFMSLYVRVGDKFKKGDILAESNFLTNGKINLGKNLLCAVMSYYGYNYEDGIIISDRLVKDESLTSIHIEDLSFNIPPNKVLLSLDKEIYKPIPNKFETIKIGKPYAILKELVSVPNFCSIFEEEIPLKVKKNMIITEVNVFANEWNTDIPEFVDWITNITERQIKDENKFKDIIFDLFPKNRAENIIREKRLNKFSHSGKYKFKNEKVNGIRVEINGIFFRDIQIGDKIVNRHGNKGIVSNIIDHQKMPKLKDGRHVDICINPLGIISRMNIGQLFELHLSMSFYNLKQEALKNLNKFSNKETKDYIIKYIEMIDSTKDKWYSNQFKEQCPDIIDENFINNLTIIQPPFESINIEQLKSIMKYTNTEFESEIYDPINQTIVQNPIAVGYLYFSKISHIAEEKLAVRGIGSYARKTLQPLGGRKNRGGQRCGEMETACLIAHDAPCNLFEFLTTKSDCIDLKNNYIKEIIESDHIKDQKEQSIVSESVKLLDAYLISIGVKRGNKN